MIYQEIRVTGVDEIEKKLGNLKSKAPTVLCRAINRAKASTAKLSAELTSKGGPIALSKFKVSPRRQVSRTKRGKASPAVYKAGVEKAGGLKPLSGNPKAFFSAMGSGHEGVMERVSSRRLPLKQLYGPAVPSMVKNEEVIERIQKEATETLEKRIDAEINNILQRG